MFPAKDFRGGVRRTTAPGAQSLSRWEPVAEAKVRDLHAHLRVEKKILGFEVPVSDTSRVAVLDSREDLSEGRTSSWLTHATVTGYVVEDFASACVFADLKIKILYVFFLIYLLYSRYIIRSFTIGSFTKRQKRAVVYEENSGFYDSIYTACSCYIDCTNSYNLCFLQSRFFSLSSICI